MNDKGESGEDWLERMKRLFDEYEDTMEYATHDLYDDEWLNLPSTTIEEESPSSVSYLARQRRATRDTATRPKTDEIEISEQYQVVRLTSEDLEEQLK